MFHLWLLLWPLSSDVVRDDADVKIESKQDSLLSIQTPVRTYQVKLTPGVSLLETSCQRSPGDTQHGSHFRLRLKVEQPTGTRWSLPMSTFSPNPGQHLEVFKESLLSLRNVSNECMSCTQRSTKNKANSSNVTCCSEPELYFMSEQLRVSWL